MILKNQIVGRRRKSYTLKILLKNCHSSKLEKKCFVALSKEKVFKFLINHIYFFLRLKPSSHTQASK